MEKESAEEISARIDELKEARHCFSNDIYYKYRLTFLTELLKMINDNERKRNTL